MAGIQDLGPRFRGDERVGSCLRCAGQGSRAAPSSNHAFSALMERDHMPAAQSIETRGGGAYATHAGVSLLGELYLPAGAGPFPALVAAHGGGWQAGARSAFQFWGPYLAARGYALFAISYRLAKKGQKMFPQAVNDVLAGVQFVRGSAAQIK